MGLFKKGGDKQVNWTDMENYEILENLDHMTNFQDLDSDEKLAIVNALKNDRGTLDLLEDYQVLIDTDQLEGEEAEEIKNAVDEILEKTIGNKVKEEKSSTGFFNNAKSSSRKQCKKLVTAIGMEDVEEVKRILETVDVNCTCNNSEIFLQIDNGNYEESRSPLVVAARTGNLEIGKLLVSHGADLELHVRGDESPLIAASKSGDLSFVKFLVEKGADVNHKIKGDGTALLEAF